MLHSNNNKQTTGRFLHNTPFCYLTLSPHRSTIQLPDDSKIQLSQGALQCLIIYFVVTWLNLTLMFMN